MFARKPRGLEDIDRWKATELRQFALYTGKIVLKGIISKQLYEHFLVFSVALSILVCPRLTEQYSHNAEEMLVYFVGQGRRLYGDEFHVYNVHSLVHLTSDAKLYGSLDECSAFSFENYLHQMKRLVCSGRNPLSQIVRRLGEADKVRRIHIKPKKSVESKHPNNVFTLSDVECCEVVEMRSDETMPGEKMFLCCVYSRLEPYFIHPCDSRLIGVYTAKDTHTRMKTPSERHLGRQAFMTEANDGLRIVVTILHSF